MASQSQSYPAPRRATGGLAGAIERGRVARSAWTRDGTLLSADAFAAARGINVAALHDVERRHEVFSLTVGGRRYYPAELLKFEPAIAAAVCRALTNADAASKLVFVLRKHGGLAGMTAAEAIAAGCLERVTQLAEDWGASA